MSINNSNKFSFSMFKDAYKGIYDIQGLDALLEQIRHAVAEPLARATLVSKNPGTTALSENVTAFLDKAYHLRNEAPEAPEVSGQSIPKMP